MIERFLKPDSIIMDLQSTERDEVLAELTESLVNQNPFLCRNDIYDSLVLREDKKSTLVQTGIAVPHAKVEGAGTTTIAVGIARNRIDFDLSGESEDSHVQVIIALVFDEHNSHDHLNVLKDVMNIVQNEGFVDEILRLDSGSEVCDYICSLR